MNIFASSSNPIDSAKYLDDKRVIKMILESAQLLSTALTLNGAKAPYRITHVNHPSNVWVRATRQNYNWLVEHFKALCKEYTNRYNKIHKCETYLDDFMKGASSIPDGTLTTLPNCTTFKHIEDVHEAYKLYLDYKWTNDKRKPTWYGEPKQ